MIKRPVQRKSWSEFGLEMLVDLSLLSAIVLIYAIGWVAGLAFALSVIYLFLTNEERAEKTWQKAVKEFVKPALIATAVVTVLSVIYGLLGHGSGDRLIAWYEILIVQLHRILKWIKPTWWLYLVLLAVATWVDIRLPSLKIASKLSKGKKWISLPLAVVTLLAGVSFFAESSVTADAYDSIQSRLQVRYDKARSEKIEAVEGYVGNRIVTAALQRVSPFQQRQMQMCFMAAARISYRNRYDEGLAELLAQNEVKALTIPKPPEGAAPEKHESSDADPISLAAAIPSEEAAAQRAFRLEASSIHPALKYYYAA